MTILLLGPLAVTDSANTVLPPHELDHLDGIEYFQRLTEAAQRSVYERLVAAGVDVSWVPPVAPR